MPGRKVHLITGCYYHVFNRGANKQLIFSDKRSYQRFLDLIFYYQYSHQPVRFSKFQTTSQADKPKLIAQLEKSPKLVEILSFCLMPNHFHLLLKQNINGGISKFLSNLQNGYTKYFNLKQTRSGHLFQGKFAAVRVDDDDQLLHVCRYIHLNPYTGFLVKNIDELDSYPWSSHQIFIGKSNFSINRQILEMFKSIKSYQEFIKDQADYQRILSYIKHLRFD